MSKLCVNAFSLSADGFGARTRPGSRYRRSCSAAPSRCFEGIDLLALGYKVKEHVSSGAAMHLVVGR
jgi:hypothetical protein